MTSVEHGGDKPSHLLTGDPGEVIADAHVEDVLAGTVTEVLRQRLPSAEHPDEHRGLHVLIDARRHRELLAPLDVVSNGLHIDARPRDVEVVDHLDRLQFEEARSPEPGEHQVLRHLRVRTGGRADRRGAAPTEELESEIDVGFRAPDARRRLVEDPVAGRPLMVDAAQQGTERHRCERCHTRHGLPSPVITLDKMYTGPA